MPARQPFTVLCQLLARPAHLDRADLHLHSTFSDGTYTPAELVDLARRCGLAALALTDHDTLEGVDAARVAARGSELEIITGVEISCADQGREMHLLAYFVHPEAGQLHQALERLCAERRQRFAEMLARLRTVGVTIEMEDLPRAVHVLGRRHLAELLVQQGKAGSVREAFQRWLHDGGRVAVPKVLLPLEEALHAVCDAGGVSSWAHPSARCTLRDLQRLQEAGLTAVETEYPTHRASRTQQLRAWARSLGLAITGGSDCHGPGEPRRSVGACTISRTELEALRARVP